MRRHASTLFGTMGMVGCLCACATPQWQLTYDRYDRDSRVYVNDTAGFAMRLDEDLRVNPHADSPQGKLFDLIPIPTGTEISMKAVGQDLGLLVETTRIARSTRLEDLQPTVFKAYESAFRLLRYQPLSLEKKSAHGIDYMEWIYRLRSPDFDRTFVEGMFVRSGYAVRVRALTDSANFDKVRSRIARLLASLTAVEAAAERLVVPQEP